MILHWLKSSETSRNRRDPKSSSEGFQSCEFKELERRISESDSVPIAVNACEQDSVDDGLHVNLSLGWLILATFNNSWIATLLRYVRIAIQGRGAMRRHTIRDMTSCIPCVEGQTIEKLGTVPNSFAWHRKISDLSLLVCRS